MKTLLISYLIVASSFANECPKGKKCIPFIVSPPVVEFVPCEDCGPYKDALGKCKKYTGALEQDNQVLRQLSETLKKQRDEATDELSKTNASPLLPWYGWLLIGAATGVVTYGVLHK